MNFAAFQEEGGLCSPPMSHGRETSNVCKQLQPSLGFLVLHPSPINADWTHLRRFLCLNWKAKQEAVGHHLRQEIAKRRGTGVLCLWTPAYEIQDRTLE